MISKIKPEKIQKLLMLELFMCLRLKLSKLFWNFYSLGITFFFQIFPCKQQFSLNLHNVFICFQTRIAKFGNLKPIKQVGWGGIIQLFITFTSTKEMKVKIYSYIIKKYIFCGFFKFV